MKMTLEKLANVGKAIKNSVKNHAKIGLVGLALASSFILSNNAKASEGEIVIDYIIGSPYTNSNWALAHYPGAEEGIDNYDTFYFPMFNSSGVASEITSNVDGKELGSDARPENSTSSASFSYEVITEDGSLVPQISNPYLSVWTNGFDGEEVRITVEGTTYDARTVGTIPLSSISGSGSVNFSGSGSGEEPVEPVDLEPVSGRLRIDNVHEKSPTATFELVYSNGATENPTDSGDVEYTRWTGIAPPFIVSKVHDTYLIKDNRETNSQTPVHFKQMYYSDVGFGRIAGGDTNTLVFSFPEENNTFGNRLITFQQYTPSEEDPNIPDPNAGTYPIYDVRELIQENEKGMGVVLLPDLERIIYTGTLLDAQIRTDKTSIADYTNDHRVDFRDYAVWAKDFGKIGNSQSDLDHDGRVDYRDLKAFSQEYTSQSKQQNE